MPSLILVPAYGRDYQGKDAVLAGFKSGQDFRIIDYFNGLDGKYTSSRDVNQLIASGFTHLEIRYKKLTRCIFIDIRTL
jgi:hypothetical protein